MDIKKFAVAETGVIELRDAGDEPMMGEDKKPITITVYGPGSKQFAKAKAAQTNRMMDIIKRKGKTDQSVEDQRRDQSEFLTACTKEVSPNLSVEGLTGEAMIKALYSDPLVGFIPEQVGRFLQDWSSFKKPSTTS